jgi:hypothetical protein
MKKTSVISLISLFLIFIFAGSAFAVDEDYHFGIQFSQESVSKADGISGGSYLYLGSAFNFNPKLSINVKYAWNIAPESYSDHLVSLESQYTFGSPEAQASSTLALVYLMNLDQDHPHYYGLRFCPISSGRAIFSSRSKMTVEMFPFEILYNTNTQERITTFEFVSFTAYF